MTGALHDELTIERFEAGAIDPSRFDHEAHVYVGWLYVTAYPRREAVARFDAALRRLVDKIGASDKYNAMITWLFLLLIAARTRADDDWDAFRARNADLLDERPGAKAA